MDHHNCMCVPIFPDHLRAPNIQPTSQDKDLNEEFARIINFDTVPVGKTEKKTFKIKNDSKVTRSYYSVEENLQKNRIFNFFEFQISKTVVKSGDYLHCIVFYTPQVVNERNVQYIDIVDDRREVIKICLKGECIGPNVIASITKMIFHESKSSRHLSNVFELRNTSKVAVTFQFEINQEEHDRPLFTVDKINGCLEPLQYQFFKVFFIAKKVGVYYQPLVCLLSYHAPIIIDLVGVKIDKECDCFLKNPSIKTFPLELEETQGYCGYMYDSLVTTIHKPPFSLSSTYLNFRLVEFDKRNSNSRTLITCLTNHLSTSIEVVWENDDCPPFLIKPKEITIPAGESVLYECQYKPTLPDQLDLKILRASIYWSSRNEAVQDYSEIIEVPLSVKLRVCGHSFPKNKEWFPKIEIIPETTVLPPTIPTSPRYTTFIMKNLSSLPTSFTFIPPERTDCLVKPMTGIIYDYQIIVVQLQPNCCEKMAYTEKWLVELNGRTNESSCFLRLKGYAESPKIIVGVDNVVAFKNVFPGCQDISTVMITNPSTHFLEYELEQNENLLIDRPKGTLASNERAFLTWYSTGRVKAPEVSTIQCKVRSAQESKRIIGYYCPSSITIYTKCCYSELCATPREHNFGEVRYGETKNTNFLLYNFGESIVNFKLITKSFSNPKEDLKIEPLSGLVHPKDKLIINLEVKVNKTEHEDIQIAYLVRLNEISDDLVDCTSYEVFHVKYFGKYPTFQVDEIPWHNFGFLFSKIMLWDLLNIDQINKSLREIQHDETECVELFMPDFEMGDSEFNVILTLTNVTNFSTELKTKRIKNCNCKPVIKSIGISFSRKTDDCVHKDMCKCTLEDNFVQANESQQLKLEIKYLERGLTDSCYKLILSDNRIINFHIKIYVLPEIVTKPSTYNGNLQLNFKNVFIGEKGPAAQSVLPLYNNSAFLVDYEIDLTPLKCLNFDYNFEIFSCINPEDTVPPFTTYDILFTFVPIEVREYEVAVSIRMGNEMFIIELYGKGVLQYESQTRKVESTMPSTSKSDLRNLIELSVDHINVEPFPVWSTVYKMFFIRNQTANRIIGYSWQTCITAQTVKVEAVYQKGVLEPKESHPIIIQINSFDTPCQLRVQFMCKLLDHTQHIKHKKSVIEFNTKRQDLEGQFCITEDGISFPVNDVVIEPNPETSYLPISIDIYITSVLDRDLHANMKEQLTFSPQYGLRINMEYIMENYLKTVIAPKPKSKLNTEKSDKQQTLNIDTDLVKHFKTVSECIIADVLFGNLFCNALVTTVDSPTPFYVQFNLKDDHTEYIEKAPRDPVVIRRLALANDFLNKPQLPLMAGILQELIADSVHELFQLGPQMKSLLHTKPYYKSYDKSFVCSVCKCNL